MVIAYGNWNIDGMSHTPLPWLLHPRGLKQRPVWPVGHVGLVAGINVGEVTPWVSVFPGSRGRVSRRCHGREPNEKFSWENRPADDEVILKRTGDPEATAMESWTLRAKISGEA